MKVLMIHSSYRKNGNTHKAFTLLEEYLQHNGNLIERVDLAEKDIGLCRGCRTCFDQGEALCPLKDDVLEIYDTMNANDIIVIGGPIYVDDVNGLLKNWIDRMAFNNHRPGLYRQKYFVFMNSGVGASRHALKTVERAFNTWGMRRIGERRIVVGAHIDPAGLRTLHRNYYSEEKIGFLTALGTKFVGLTIIKLILK